MTLEDGTGKTDANNYVSVAAADAYHQSRGNTAWLSQNLDDGKKETVLVRGTAWVDARYRGRFPGYRRQGRLQALEWPRVLACSGFDPLPYDSVPREIVAAVCEAALRELVKPNSLSPDLKRGGAIQSVSAGSASVTYATNAPSGTTFTAIDEILGPVLVPDTGAVGELARG